MKYESILEDLPLVAMISLVGSFGILYLTSDIFSRETPNNSKVQKGYVIPSKLEIKVQDLDGVNGKETILKYDGIDYLFTLSDDGKPQVQDYEIIPEKIVVKD